jgi:hypothetical protein
MKNYEILKVQRDFVCCTELFSFHWRDQYNFKRIKNLIISEFLPRKAKELVKQGFNY